MRDNKERKGTMNTAKRKNIFKKVLGVLIRLAQARAFDMETIKLAILTSSIRIWDM